MTPTSADDRAPLFLYGTLRDSDLLAIISGETNLRLSDAAAPGRFVACVANASFPALIERDGAVAAGLLAEGVSAEGMRRLHAYEGDEYALEPIEVLVEGAPRRACVFTPTARLRARVIETPWSFEHWRDLFAPRTRAAAREFVSYGEEGETPESDLLWPDMLGRAEAEVGMPKRLASPRALADVEIVESRRAYDGFHQIDELAVRRRRYDGAPSEIVRRAVFRSGPAVVVLPYDPARDRVLLIEQWRAGPTAAGAAEPWLIEVVAGRIEAGATPEAAARAEAREEAGIELTRLLDLGAYWSSPGGADELCHYFLGEADLHDEVGGLHGLPEEGEDIRVIVAGRVQALAAAARGEIQNATTMLALFMLERNRLRLATLWRD